MVAGVDKVEAVDSAKVLPCALLAEEKTGIVAVGRKAGIALNSLTHPANRKLVIHKPQFPIILQHLEMPHLSAFGNYRIRSSLKRISGTAPL